MLFSFQGPEIKLEAEILSIMVKEPVGLWQCTVCF